MTFVRRKFSRGKWVVLAALPLLIGGLYGLNWLILHPGFMTALHLHPLFERPQPADVIVPLAKDIGRDQYATLLVARGVAPRILSTLVDTACLRARGVRARCATGVRNTVDEALAMRRILAWESVDRVMIVRTACRSTNSAIISDYTVPAYS